LKRFARCFVKERMDSLQKDVIHCLQWPFCFISGYILLPIYYQFIRGIKYWPSSNDISSRLNKCGIVYQLPKLIAIRSK
jgi:hypothetical protein